MRPLLVAAPALLVACQESEATTREPFELYPVVVPQLRAAEARIAEAAAAAGPAAEVDPDQIHGLTTMVGNADESMRAIAIEEIQQLGPGCVPVLAALVRDESASDAERAAAIELLGALDCEAGAEVLLEQVESGKPAWTRAHAAWRLSASSQDWIVPRLVLRLKYEKDHDTVIWIASAAARFDNFSGLMALDVVATRSPEEELRASAAARMALIAQEAGFEDVATLWSAWFGGEDVQRFHPPRSERFDLEIWRWIARFEEFQLRGVDDGRYVLERMGPRAAELLAESLHDDNVYVRVHAAQSLERIGPRAVTAGETLVAALADEILAANAASALGSLRYAPAEAELAQLTTLKDLELSLAATRALGGFGEDADETTRTALEAAFTYGLESEERQAAAESLVYIGAGDEVLPALCEFLTSAQVEPETSARAIRHWLGKQAEAGSDEARQAAEEWDALAFPSEAIVPVEEIRAARAARREIVERLLEEGLD